MENFMEGCTVISVLDTGIATYNIGNQIIMDAVRTCCHSDIRKYRQWDLSFCNIMRLKGLVLMGCGWWQYEHADTTPYTRWALHKVLSDKYLHSVRDSYTEKRLKDIGIDNRAAEMQKDFGLPVTPANDIRSIGRLIEGDYILHLNIPFDNISRWKKQFSHL